MNRKLLQWIIQKVVGVVFMFGALVAAFRGLPMYYFVPMLVTGCGLIGGKSIIDKIIEVIRSLRRTARN